MLMHGLEKLSKSLDNIKVGKESGLYIPFSFPTLWRNYNIMPHHLFENVTTHTTHTPQETLLLGEKIAEALKTLPPQPIALIGDLGSGKTTLAKGIIHGLTGIPYDDVTSPTFQYASLFVDSTNTYHIAHCDLWRLSGEEEFLELGLADLFEDHFMLIEWPDRIHSLIPSYTLTIQASWTEEKERTYTFFVPYSK